MQGTSEEGIASLGPGKVESISRACKIYVEFKRGLGKIISEEKEEAIYQWLITGENDSEPRRCHEVIDCEFNTAYAILEMEEGSGRENVVNLCTMPKLYLCYYGAIAQPVGEIAYFYVKSLSMNQLQKRELVPRHNRKEFQYNLSSQLKRCILEDKLPFCYTSDCGHLAHESNVDKKFREDLRLFLTKLRVPEEAGLCTNLEMYLCSNSQTTEDKK